ncbi:hypothetical protein MED15_05230 [Micromonospora noduli]|uniref:Uncharacterized protein n=1 Tax=Micromonospora noduli TaxID=709876 RepID=A0A328N065_9ACTN|nr:hypothetical protein LAH08_03891 [Micromonospora noduli]RAO12221.1 hypothetical protein MED15_05230 [Micromonospora noduli]
MVVRTSGVDCRHRSDSGRRHGTGPLFRTAGPVAGGAGRRAEGSWWGYPPQALAGCWVAWTVVTSRPATTPVARTVAEPAATDDARVLNDW